MTLLPAGVKVHLAIGYTDMRKGMEGLALLVPEVLFADDTPIRVLDPGRGRKRTGRLRVHVRYDRPWDGPDPTAAVCFYSPDRRAASALDGMAVRIFGPPRFGRRREVVGRSPSAARPDTLAVPTADLAPPAPAARGLSSLTGRCR